MTALSPIRKLEQEDNTLVFRNIPLHTAIGYVYLEAKFSATGEELIRVYLQDKFEPMLDQTIHYPSYRAATLTLFPEDKLEHYIRTTIRANTSEPLI